MVPDTISNLRIYRVARVANLRKVGNPSPDNITFLHWAENGIALSLAHVQVAAYLPALLFLHKWKND